MTFVGFQTYINSKYMEKCFYNTCGPFCGFHLVFRLMFKFMGSLFIGIGVMGVCGLQIYHSSSSDRTDSKKDWISAEASVYICKIIKSRHKGSFVQKVTESKQSTSSYVRCIGSTVEACDTVYVEMHSPYARAGQQLSVSFTILCV